jgi:hypothetical protein
MHTPLALSVPCSINSVETGEIFEQGRRSWLRFRWCNLLLKNQKDSDVWVMVLSLIQTQRRMATNILLGSSTIYRQTCHPWYSVLLPPNRCCCCLHRYFHTSRCWHWIKTVLILADFLFFLKTLGGGCVFESRVELCFPREWKLQTPRGCKVTKIR